MSSTASLSNVIVRTKASGAMYVNKYPTLSAGMNYDREISRKNKL
jgi:hypothetical protein